MPVSCTDTLLFLQDFLTLFVFITLSEGKAWLSLDLGLVIVPSCVCVLRSRQGKTLGLDKLIAEENNGY